MIMSTIDRKSHASFYEKELAAIEQEILTYFESEAMALRSQKRLFVGVFQGIDKKRSNIIVKFRKNFTPQLKIPYTAFTLPVEFGKPNDWGGLTYREIRKRAINGSDVLPVFYMSSESPDFSLIGFGDVEASFAQALNPGELIVIAEREPPFEYLVNLKKLVEEVTPASPTGKILNIATDSKIWHPELLSGNGISKGIIERLQIIDEIVVQGPPGTGKTYVMSQLCDHYLSEGKSIFVAALTNTALIELAEKPKLRPWLASKRVWKTRISMEEQQFLPKLQRPTTISSMPGHIMLTTFYTMSREAIKDEVKPVFDIVILEEASQAFLATIAACRSLARKLIIVGDHMQLEPIVRQPNPQSIHERIAYVIEGLKTYAFSSGAASVRLTESYRLTPKATTLTGLFYENSLTSKSGTALPISLNSEYSNLFDPQGGTSLYLMEISDEGREPETAILFIQKMVENLHQSHPGLEIAILAPFRTTVRALQEKVFSTFDKHEWLTIETIDRIQGLTCDLTIFLIPFGGAAFGLKPNRFNVATSRAKLGTLIITDKRYEKPSNVTGPVAEYWAGLMGVDMPSQN